MRRCAWSTSPRGQAWARPRSTGDGPPNRPLLRSLLSQLAAPHIAVADSGNTHDELLAAVTNPMRAVTETDFGPVIKALLSQIASNPSLGDPFRATVVEARRAEVARVIQSRDRPRRSPTGCRCDRRHRAPRRACVLSTDVRRCARSRIRRADRRQRDARLQRPRRFRPESVTPGHARLPVQCRPAHAAGSAYLG